MVERRGRYLGCVLRSIDRVDLAALVQQRATESLTPFLAATRGRRHYSSASAINSVIVMSIARAMRMMDMTPGFCPPRSMLLM